jgi:hypothetical protein
MERSPFTVDDGEARELVRERGGDGTRLLVLVAPFHDEHVGAAQRTDSVGGFRGVIRETLLAVPWAGRYTVVDGLLRPLIHTDVDLARIRQVLAGLPVVVLWGRMGIGRRAVAGCLIHDVVPGREPIDLTAPGRAIPMTKDGNEAFLTAVDALAADMAITAGIAADWFALHHARTPPELARLAGTGRVAPEIALAAASGGDTSRSLDWPLRFTALNALADALPGQPLTRDAVVSLAIDLEEFWASAPWRDTDPDLADQLYRLAARLPAAPPRPTDVAHQPRRWLELGSRLATLAEDTRSAQPGHAGDGLTRLLGDYQALASRAVPPLVRAELSGEPLAPLPGNRSLRDDARTARTRLRAAWQGFGQDPAPLRPVLDVLTLLGDDHPAGPRTPLALPAP